VRGGLRVRPPHPVGGEGARRVSGAPFQGEDHPLGPALLKRLRPEEAGQVATEIARIPPWRLLGYTAERLGTYLARPDPGQHFYAIHRTGRIVGAVAVRSPWLRGPYLELLCIFPEAQGQGLGSACLAWLEAESRPQAGNLWCLCSAFNTAGRAFYRRHGFVEIGAIPELLLREESELLLRKVLRPPGPP